MKILAIKFWNAYKDILSCILILVCPFLATAQHDTLQTIRVQGLHWITSEPGTKLNLIDSNRLNNNISGDIAQVLSTTTPIYFKNSGISGLSSVGLRGTSASHTALMWNGINIQLPSLQQIDYSILPVVFWDEIGVQYGPTVSLSGSDIAGGAIHLVNNRPRNGFHLKYLSQAGSFGYQQQALSVAYGKGKISAKSRFNYLSATNDFKFKLYNGQEVTQQNAAVEQYNFLQQIYYSTPKVTWKNVFWYGNNDRELARTITGYNDPMQDNEQQDEFFRFLSSVEGTANNIIWEINYSYLHDNLIYNEEENSSTQHIFRGQLKYELTEALMFTGGGQVSNSKVGTAGYEEKEQVRADYFIKGTADIYKWKTHLGFKQIIIEGFDVPFLPSAGFERKILDSDKIDVKGSGKLARHFRFPTFNDLYWNPGGNPDLKPEKGWSTEGTVQITYSDDAVFSLAATYFYLGVEDWILWVPTDAGYWVPENVWKVNSHGIETDINGYFEVGSLPIEAKLIYSFTKSLNKSQGNTQLTYVPIHQANFFWQVNKNSWFFNQNTSFNGMRYTTQDNRDSDSLPAFILFDAAVGYNFYLKSILMKVQMEVDNVFSTDYQTLQNRAMPGRSFQFQVHINLNNSKNEKS